MPSRPLLLSLLGAGALLSAADLAVLSGTKQRFEAIGYDQFGHPMPTQPTFSWAQTGGEGTLTPLPSMTEAVFQAPATSGGTSTIQVTGGGITDTVEIEILASEDLLPPWTPHRAEPGLYYCFLTGNLEVLTSWWFFSWWSTAADGDHEGLVDDINTYRDVLGRDESWILFWVGYLDVPADGVYTFTITGHDSAALVYGHADGNGPLVESDVESLSAGRWSRQGISFGNKDATGPTTARCRYGLKQGRHLFNVACHNYFGDHSFELHWSDPTGDMLQTHPIPSGVWSHEQPYLRLTLDAVDPEMWSILDPDGATEAPAPNPDQERFEIPIGSPSPLPNHFPRNGTAPDITARPTDPG